MLNQIQGLHHVTSMAGARAQTMPSSPTHLACAG